jgi:flagellar biosynthesis component FlhA
MLVSYHMQPHDLTLLLLPLAVLFDDFLRGRAMSNSIRLRPLEVSLAAAVVMLILPLAAVFMAKGLNYLVAFAVVIIMVAAATRAPRMT